MTIVLMDTNRKQRFKVKFQKYYPMMCRMAYGYVPVQDDCEDIVQDLFVSVWNRKKDELPEEEFVAYITTSIKNNCISFIRKRRNVDIVSADAMPTALANVPEEDCRENNDSEVLDHILGILPPKCREVFEMNKLRKMKYREIAAALSISEKTVENHMGKALKLMRSYVQNMPAKVMLLFVSLYIVDRL